MKGGERGEKRWVEIMRRRGTRAVGSEAGGEGGRTRRGKWRVSHQKRRKREKMESWRRKGHLEAPAQPVFPFKSGST